MGEKLVPAAERRRQRDVQLWRLARMGWGHRDIATVAGLSVRQVKNRLRAMAEAAGR